MRDSAQATEDEKFVVYTTMRESRQSEMCRTSTPARFTVLMQQMEHLKLSLPDLKNVNDWQAYALVHLSTREQFMIPVRYWGPKTQSHRLRVIQRLWDWVRALKSSKLQFGWRYVDFNRIQ